MVRGGFKHGAAAAALSILTACSASFKTPDEALLSESTTETTTEAVWDFRQTFPGEGGYTEVSHLPTTAEICDSVTVAGITGSAVCQGPAAGTTATAAQVLTGTWFWDATGASVQGTMPVGTNVTGGDGLLSFAVPTGYYDGTRTAQPADTDLLSTNIANGVTILGVLGTAAVEAHIACAANGAVGCATNASYLAGAPVAANYNAPNGVLVVTAPTGYYDGTTKTITVNDTNLLTGNIRNGVNIFGVAGNANVVNTSTGDAVAADILLGKIAWVDGVAVTGTLPTQTISAASTTVSAGYYAATTLDAVDANLVTTNIRSGVTLFGVAGNSNVVNTGSGDAVAGEIVNGKKAWVDGVEITGSLSAQTLSAASTTVNAGIYSGTTLDAVDTDLISTNIRSGVTLFGVAGNANVVDTSSGDAVAADILTGKIAWVDGASVTGTMANRTNFSGADGSLSFAIPAGYYDGTRTGTAVDADLVAGNIVAGVVIMGVTGTMGTCTGGNQNGCISSASFPSQATPSNPAAAGDVVTGYGFYVGGALQTGSLSTQSLSAASTTVNAGVYTATALDTVDTDLTSTNIRSGVTLFGITGDNNVVNTSSGDAAAGEVLSARIGWVDGASVTGTMADRATWNLTTSFPGAGYFSAVSNVPTASTICSGTTIFGVSGSANCATLNSTALRIGVAGVTMETETVTGAATVYPTALGAMMAAYAPNASNEYVQEVDRTGWSTTTCGTTGTIAARIADCATTFGANATWNGAAAWVAKGGEGEWKLVTRTGDNTIGRGREVWRDQRTGLLWSSLISTSINWCKAVGSNDISGNPAQDSDPSGYCDNSANQNTAGQAVSACFEDNGTYFTQTDAAIDSAGKAGLGRTSTPVVGWRVPTENDYAQAEVDGIRAVMPDMTSVNEWTSTIARAITDDVYAARVYGPVSNDLFGYSTRNNSVVTGVRCVGR